MHVQVNGVGFEVIGTQGASVVVVAVVEFVTVQPAIKILCHSVCFLNVFALSIKIIIPPEIQSP